MGHNRKPKMPDLYSPGCVEVAFYEVDFRFTQLYEVRIQHPA
jgi:hypothetical protein